MKSFAVTEREIDTIIMQIEVAKIVDRYAHLKKVKKQKLHQKLNDLVFKLIECLRSVDTEFGDSEPTQFHRRIDNHIRDLKMYLRSVDVAPRYKHPLSKQSESVKTSLSQQ